MRLVVCGSILIETDRQDMVTMVDTRIIRWLMQWLDREKAINFALSLSKCRLIELIDAYQSDIKSMPV